MVLTCTAKGSYTYKWINGSGPVVADGTHVTVVTNALTVTGVYRTDLRGPIYCIAENALESGKSAPFNMTVSCKYPQIHTFTFIYVLNLYAVLYKNMFLREQLWME